MGIPTNPGTAIITNISNSAPIIVTTAAPYLFPDQSFVTLVLPVIVSNTGITYPNGMKQAVGLSGIITYVTATTFSMNYESVNFDVYVNNRPAYAVPSVYSCYANPTPEFQPAYRLITAITNGFPASVTTSFAHNFVTGIIVRLDLTQATGMYPVNQQIFPVTVTSPTTFTIPLDTRNLGAFALPSPTGSSNPQTNICPLVVPIGETSNILYAATQNVLPL